MNQPPLDIERYIKDLRRRKEELLAQLDDVNASLEEIQHEINMAEVVRESYCRHFRLEMVKKNIVDQELRGKFANLSIKDMLWKIGQEADGVLDLGDARRILVRAGVFKDERNATTSIAPILSRHEDVFKRIGRGLYLLIGSRPSNLEEHSEKTHVLPLTPTGYFMPMGISASPGPKSGFLIGNQGGIFNEGDVRCIRLD